MRRAKQGFASQSFLQRSTPLTTRTIVSLAQARVQWLSYFSLYKFSKTKDSGYRFLLA